MGVNTTSSMLPLGLSHQFGFLQRGLVVGLPATRAEGPVPLALREAKLSSCRRVLRLEWSCASRPRPLFAMRASVSSRSLDGVGAFEDQVDGVVIDLLHLLDALHRDIMLDGGVPARVSENTTSSAVNGAPSWNLTPLRSSKRTCVGEICVHGGQAGSVWYLPS